MTEKISTLILRVDLQCTICSKKIKKALGKLKDRDREGIQSVVYDEKENVVIVSGLFDPKRLSRRLCCKACKIIKEVQIKENKLVSSPPPPPSPVPAPNPPALSLEPAPPAAEPALPPPSNPETEPEPVPPEPKPAPEPEPKPAPEPEPEPAPAPQPATPAPEAEPEKPAPEAEPEKPAPEPINPDPLVPYLYPYPYPFQYPYPTVWPFIPVCGCHGWCSCKTAAEPLPSAEPYYDGCKTCQFICEDEPSICSIM